MAASVGRLGDWDWCYMVASVGSGANYNRLITIGTVALHGCLGRQWILGYMVASVGSGVG